MLHQDGSTHEWVPDCQWDLIVTLDDATTEIYSTFFVEEEGTLSSFRGLQKVIESTGLFSSLYTDRGSHDWLTEEAGGRVDTTGLRLAVITEMATANQYLTTWLLPASNQRFAAPAPEAGTTFIPSPGSACTSPRLCVCKTRGAWPRIPPCTITASAYRHCGPTSIPLREDHGAGERISGWDPGCVPWPPVLGARPNTLPIIRSEWPWVRPVSRSHGLQHSSVCSSVFAWQDLSP